MKKEDNFHSLSIKETLKILSSDVTGISKQEAKIRLEKYGFNEITEKKKYSIILAFLKQFKSIFIFVLIAAAVISLLIGNMIDVYVILAVILINSTIGFIQEYKAERSIKALKKMIVPYAKVFRENELLKIPAKELVLGDVIFLEEGDRIPADAKIIEIKNLRTMESALTGESMPIDKDIKVLSEKTPLADRKNMVWMGTFITSGQSKAIVTATGNKTIIGKLAEDIEKIEKIKGHFQRKIDKLAKKIGIITIIGALLIFIVGFFIRGFEFTEISLFTLASMVAIIPEGLPAIIAIVLSIGASKMAKKNAIIRTLSATETLGVVNVIITDKTGTLTKNTMNVEKIILPDQEEITVSGEGYNPMGNFKQENDIVPSKNPVLLKLLSMSTILANARVIKKEKDYEIIGDPTDASLIVLSEKAGLKKETINEKIIDEIPFRPELKYKASLIKQKNKKQIYFLCAPELALSKSKNFLKGNLNKKIDTKKRKELTNKIDNLTENAMRVLALAYKDVSSNLEKLSEDMLKDLTFVGLVGIRDPPRPEVKDAIAKAKKAGIRVIMTTGDHKNTAVAIAKEVGLINKNKKSNISLTDTELLNMNSQEFEKALNNVSVFARLTPKTKLKIAEVLQKQGKIIAMTGDGVNDAPALKKADIGISMGIIGTDVARQSSEIILADDNFATIINAIEEGRSVFKNTRRSTSFLITTNLAEEATILTTLFIGFPLPLLPTQILWLNLVTDTMPSLALATEKSTKNILEQKPRKAKEDILSKRITPFLFLIVAVMVTATLIIFNSYLQDGLDKARTGAFAVMTFTQLFNVLNLRSLRESIFKLGFLTNKNVIYAILISIALVIGVLYIPFFQKLFHFVALSLVELLVIVLISSLVLWFGELYKIIKNKA